VPSAQLAREMTAAYVADTDALGLGRPDHEPLATETIEQIVALIQALIDRGHAYAVEGDVYFDVRSYPAYGELSHRHVDDMDQGEEDPDPARPALKRDPLDFALWKAQKEGEDTAWDAPWGRGRPGWHIECSAMAETLLGVGFDIHGGGSDLVFPHHENEAAQTAAARGAPLTRLWVHNGMVRLEGEKMAKSVGNIFLLHEALAAHGRDALILYFCGGHYRQPIAYSAERLDEAARSAARIRDAGRRLVPGVSPSELAPLREAFFDALAEDFNTPKALATAFEWVREANRRAEAGEQVGDADLREMLAVLALDALLDADAAAAGPDAAAQELLDRREAARAARDFAEADRLRGELADLGWEVRDGAAGPTLVPR
jgi:cysteinyl-tRNA synthetase